MKKVSFRSGVNVIKLNKSVVRIFFRILFQRYKTLYFCIMYIFSVFPYFFSVFQFLFLRTLNDLFSVFYNTEIKSFTELAPFLISLVTFDYSV